MGKQNNGPGAVPPPQVLAAVVCDAIWRDPWLGECTLLGTFSTIQSSMFPARHPILSLYAALTNGHGKVALRVRIVDVDEERAPIAELEQEVEFEDPKVVAEFGMQFTNLSFPQPGEYRVQLFSGSTPLCERRLTLMKAAEKDL